MMKKNTFLIALRFFILAFLLFLNAFIPLFLLVRFRTYAGLYLLAFRLIGILASFYVAGCRLYPEEKISWILAMTVIPIIGVPVFFTLGRYGIAYRLAMKKLCKMSICKKGLQSCSSSFFVLDPQRFAVYNDFNAHLFSETDKALNEMLVELQNAEKTIYLEYYIISPGTMWNNILTILAERSLSGVDIRIIYDDVGSLPSLSPDVISTLSHLGIQSKPFSVIKPYISPDANIRDHRKLMVIDRKTAFIGGMNISDEYINKCTYKPYWKDCVMKTVGDAVGGFEDMFISMWNGKIKETDYQAIAITNASIKGIQPYCSFPSDSDKVIKSVFFRMIRRSVKYIWIMTPYLIPGYEMIFALCECAKSGVDVRIITPSMPDKIAVHIVTRSHYRELAESGVMIYEYKKGFIHSKVILSDDNCASVGSANFDFRSMNILCECGAVIYSHEVIKDIKEDFLNTLDESRMINVKKCSMTGKERIISYFLRPFEPLL